MIMHHWLCTNEKLNILYAFLNAVIVKKSQLYTGLHAHIKECSIIVVKYYQTMVPQSTVMLPQMHLYKQQLWNHNLQYTINNNSLKME